ncbi:hypothetical protein ABZY14_18320 [Streptomyces sp. NPDC006617]|uniref:hypothetical protein n=1 Tax=Streptomyces sp. NPDC006617 TaxID=3155354 RepID=UPI0033A40824
MTGRRDVDEELRVRLREAAGAHQPDRARILARVERGMSVQDRPGQHRSVRAPLLGWVRVAGATAAVAGVLVAGGYAVASAVKDEAPAQRSVATSPTSAPSPGDATTGRPAASGVQDGPLWSDGSVDPHSNDFWAQSNVTLKASAPLTALTVELWVAQTGSVTSTGAWRSLPEGDFTLTVEERDGFLVHRWTLKPGRTVPAGEWMFAGQYNHERGGRDARGDRYSATATADSEQLSVRGDFAPRDGDS